MTKIKNVLFKLNLKGQGIVNYDSGEQKFVFDKNQKHLTTRHNNVSYAKKNFYKDSEGNQFYKIKISSDALKHSMFEKEVIAQTPNVSHNDALLYSYISSPVSLLRGYLFTNKVPIKRKGALTLCDAEQTNNSLSKLDFFNRSGERKIKEDGDEKSDNTLYKKETIGKIEYETMGNIDLMQLQFVSCDSVFDRYSFNPDKYNLYEQFISMNLPNYNSHLGYYQMKNTSIEIPEYGILLNNDNVNFLVKKALTNMLDLNIKRSDAFAKTSNIQIKLVEDPTKDTFEDENGWIDIKSSEDVDKINFDAYEFYEEIDTDVAKKQRTEIEEVMKQKIKEEKEAKKAKKWNI